MSSVLPLLSRHLQLPTSSRLSWSSGGRRSRSGRTQFEDPDQLGSNNLQFRRRQFAKSSLQPNDGDRLNLLQMEYTGLEKRLRDRKFPSIVADGRRMRNQNHQ